MSKLLLYPPTLLYLVLESRFLVSPECYDRELGILSPELDMGPEAQTLCLWWWVTLCQRSDWGWVKLVILKVPCVFEGNPDFQCVSLPPFYRQRQQAEGGAVACLMPHGQEVPCDSLSALPLKPLPTPLCKSGNLAKVGNKEMKGIYKVCPFLPSPSASSQVHLPEGRDEGQGGRETPGAGSELAKPLGSTSLVLRLVVSALWSLAASYLPGI